MSVSIAASPGATHTKSGSPLFVALFFLAPLVKSALPRLTPLLLPILGSALIIASWRRGASPRQLLQPSAALALCLLLTVYVFINSLMALDQGAALVKAVVLLCTILIVFAAARAADMADPRQIRRAAVAYVAGVVLGALYLTLELLTHGAVTRAIMNFISVLQPASPKHVTIVDGVVTKISLNQFNQKATSLILQLWPALLMLSHLEGLAKRNAIVVSYFVIISTPILLSEHDSSKVALLVSTVAFVFASFWGRSVIFALAGLWCASYLLVIPLDTAAYKLGWHQAHWLPSSFRARIVIWEHTTEQISAKPWFGVGVRSTQEMQKPSTPTVERSQEPGRGLGRHAHSLFLQTWFELGTIGAVLAALAGGAVATRIRLLPKGAQPFGVATFVAFATIAAFAWGLWETWWMASVGLAALYLSLGAAEAFEQPAWLSEVD